MGCLLSFDFIRALGTASFVSYVHGSLRVLEVLARFIYSCNTAATTTVVWCFLSPSPLRSYCKARHSKPFGVCCFDGTRFYVPIVVKLCTSAGSLFVTRLLLLAGCRVGSGGFCVSCGGPPCRSAHPSGGRGNSRLAPSWPRHVLATQTFLSTLGAIWLSFSDSHQAMCSLHRFVSSKGLVEPGE